MEGGAHIVWMKPPPHSVPFVPARGFTHRSLQPTIILKGLPAGCSLPSPIRLTSLNQSSVVEYLGSQHRPPPTPFPMMGVYHLGPVYLSMQRPLHALWGRWAVGG